MLDCFSLNYLAVDVDCVEDWQRNFEFWIESETENENESKNNLLEILNETNYFEK